MITKIDILIDSLIGLEKFQRKSRIQCSSFQLFFSNRDQDIDFSIRAFVIFFEVHRSMTAQPIRFKLGKMFTYGVNSRSTPNFL